MAETTEHSAMYAELLSQYKMHYVTKATLKKRVALNNTKPDKGITTAEYEEITGEVYEA